MSEYQQLYTLLSPTYFRGKNSLKVIEMKFRNGEKFEGANYLLAVLEVMEIDAEWYDQVVEKAALIIDVGNGNVKTTEELTHRLRDIDAVRPFLQAAKGRAIDGYQYQYIADVATYNEELNRDEVV